MDYDDNPDSDLYEHESPGTHWQLEAQSPKVDELEDDDTDKTPAQIIQDTIAECPSAFLKFRVIDPQVAAKQAKKQAAAEKRKQTAARKREERQMKAASTQKRKREEALSDNECINEEKKTSKPKKKKAN